MTQRNLNHIALKPGEREELQQLFAYTEKMRADMKSDPELARQFLKDIGLLDANGNRVDVEDEEPLHANGHNGNGDGGATQ